MDKDNYLDKLRHCLDGFSVNLEEEELCYESTGYSKAKLGRRVRDLRIDWNLCLDDLADDLGFSLSKLSKIERGCQKVSPSDLVKISELFGVSTDYLLIGRDNYDELDRLTYGMNTKRRNKLAEGLRAVVEATTLMKREDDD